jgi:hypothetical protein
MASDLKDLKSSGIEKVKIKYKHLEDASSVEHRVGWKGLFAPWKERDKRNRLESSWFVFQRVLNRDKRVFKVAEKKVGPGDGEVEVEWHVWDDSEKLLNVHVEHYSVMRAEEWFIRRGFEKTASKYFCYVQRKIKGRKLRLPSENSGIDSFFRKGSEYVVCESKFTRDEVFFEDCKADRSKAYPLLRPYKGLRQMSWEWIEDRAIKAQKNPAGMRGADAATKKEIRTEVRDMKKAIQDEDNVKRYLNIFGSNRLPVLPGTYAFRSATNHLTENELNLRWTLDLDEHEFIELDIEFINWCDSHPASED